MTRIVDSLAEIASGYDAVFCDLWGCVHDGVRALPEAVAALRAYRAAGGVVVLLTNAPRPRAAVARQIAGMGVPEDAWDSIATSGDAARAAMYRGAVGRRVWFVGDETQRRAFFQPPAIVSDPVDVAAVPLEAAEGIVCTGLFDPQDDPEDLREPLRQARARGLRLLCANPDIVVDRGDVREWCAGAVAGLYEELGGESLYFGKPWPAVYALARERLAGIRGGVADDRILAIGDGLLTDVKGAAAEGLDALYVTGGLAQRETGTGRQPDPDRLADYLAAEGEAPDYAIGFLR